MCACLSSWKRSTLCCKSPYTPLDTPFIYICTCRELCWAIKVADLEINLGQLVLHQEQPHSPSEHSSLLDPKAALCLTSVLESVYSGKARIKDVVEGGSILGCILDTARGEPGEED